MIPNRNDLFGVNPIIQGDTLEKLYSLVSWNKNALRGCKI